MKLKQIVEDDRQLKAGAPKADMESNMGDDMISKVFVRKTHQAYERSAKNDKICNLIGDKF
jgi:hypothetical protein